MKFWEAIKLAQEESKRIREIDWYPQCYLEIDDDGFFRDENYEPSNILGDRIDDEWEIYEEAKEIK